MRKRIGFQLTFANVISMAALFVALGGTATAVTYVVSSNSQIGPGTISGHNPPSGKHSNIIAGSINGKDIEAPKLHLLNAPGEPSFQHGCANVGSVGLPVGFFKDDQGVVHLQGIYSCPSSNTVAFQLPPGYRPAPQKHADFPLAQGGPGDFMLVAGPNTGGPAGGVESTSNIGFLDGITFLAQG
jgi:hypothetical protein